MVNLFTSIDICAMCVTHVSPKCVRLANEGKVYFISHDLFNKIVGNPFYQVYLLPVTKVHKNVYGVDTEITFLQEMKRVVPPEVKRAWEEYKESL